MKTPILFDVYEIKEAIKVCKHVCMCVFIHVDTAQGRAWITWCVLARSLATFVILAPTAPRAGGHVLWKGTFQ